MNRKSRLEILDDFRNELSKGNILLGVGAGTGITAKQVKLVAQIC